MSLSDYTVGTNHIYLHAGSAKFSSGLNINEFIKKISIVTLSKLGVEKIGNPAIKLSEYENYLLILKVLNLELKRLNLAKQDTLEFKGKIIDLLPNAMFRVKLKMII